MNHMKNVLLFWVDLETTDLDPRRGQIIEAAWCVTDMDLHYRTPLTSTLVYSTWWLTRYHNRQDFIIEPAIREMHKESGLEAEWDMAHEAGKLTGADQLCTLWNEMLEGLWTEGMEFYLAGSNCDFERRWINYHLPAFDPDERFSHRAMDVSRLRTAHEAWRPHVARLAHARADDQVHRAAADLRHHMQEAAIYRQHLMLGSAYDPQLN